MALGSRSRGCKLLLASIEMDCADSITESEATEVLYQYETTPHEKSPARSGFLYSSALRRIVTPSNLTARLMISKPTEIPDRGSAPPRQRRNVPSLPRR